MYELSILVEGFPGKSPTHGGLGWSTIGLLQMAGRAVVVDGGSFGIRDTLLSKLEEKGLHAKDITHVLLTHSHWDHSVNWTLFPNAEIVISRIDLEWALNEPPGGWQVPELYVKELSKSGQLRTVEHMEEVLPHITVHQVAGHTPGHVSFVVEQPTNQVIFAGDAAKNRAELLSREADMTLDPELSKRSIRYLWDIWERSPGNLMIPGHDLPMILEDGVPRYVTKRNAVLTAWFGNSLDDKTVFHLDS